MDDMRIQELEAKIALLEAQIAMLDVSSGSGDDAMLKTTGDACSIPMIYGGGGETDGKSLDADGVDDEGNDGAHELLEFQTAGAEADTLVAKLVDSSASTDDIVERHNGNGGPNTVQYRSPGRVYSGYDSNIQFTVDADGNVEINVYYV